MKSKFNIVEGYVPATPRSQRKRNASFGGGTTVVVEGSGGKNSVPDPNSHTHTNLPLLESLADQEGYLTRREENPDSGEDADPFIYSKFKSGFADKAEDSDKWKGNTFSDFLNQPVRKEDAVKHKSVTVSESVTSDDFIAGDFSGSGFGFYFDANGNAVGEVDIIKARKEAVFNTAIINQVTFQIGATVFSNGGCKIARVEELDDVYRCYYDTKEGRRLCSMVVDDQARCQQYDPSQNTIVKYYWRLVVAVGDDYVDLSKTDVDGSDIPEEGDEIAQFGHRTDKTRQGATIIDPKDGSSVVVYSGIDSYSLSKKNYVGMGTNPQTGRAYLFCYGDFFLGDRELKDQFLTFQIPEGQTVPQLFARMNISLGSGSSGLTNMTEWPEKQKQLDAATKNAQDAKTTAETANKIAEGASKLAQNAAKELEIIQSDEYVSAVEKQSLKLRQTDMQAEYSQIVAEAEKYGLTKVEGPFQCTPEYWEQGAADTQYTGYLWDDMKFESTKYIRTQMLLYAFAKAKFSVGTGFMVQAVCFGSDTHSISRTGTAQSITITDENTVFVSLIISKTSDADIVPEELADAALTVSVESSGGGEDLPSADDIKPVDFEKAYNAANAALDKYTSPTPENIPIESDFGDIYDYYTVRQIILDAIAYAVKAHLDTLSDYEYLKEVFPSMVLDSNGVFLSRLMAVKNGTDADAEVVAGSYGGGVESLNNAGFMDPTHGVLMFFAGAENVQSVASAKTRIYGDGHIVTNDIEANGGIFGIFNIGEDEHGYNSINYSSVSAVDPSYVIQNTITCNYIDLYGHNVNNSSVSNHIILGVGDIAFSEGLVSIYGSSSPLLLLGRNKLNDGGVSLKNESGGIFEGLNYPVRTITSGETIDRYDHVLITSGGSTMYITLPSNPPTGKELVICKLSTPKLRLLSYNSILTPGAMSSLTYLDVGENECGIVNLIFDGASWIVFYTKSTY